MYRLVAILIMCVIAVPAVLGHAGRRVVQRVVMAPCGLAAGDTLWIPVDSVGAALVEARCEGRRWRLAYDVKADGSMRYMDVVPQSAFADAEIDGGKAGIEIGIRADGRDSVTGKYRLSGVDEAVSVAVSVRDAWAECYAGSRGVEYMGGMDAGSLGMCCLVASEPVKVKAVVLEKYRDNEPVMMSRIEVKGDSLLNDPIIGEWYYLDRSNDPAKARPGGEYRLHIQPSANAACGHYDMLYVDGARVNAGMWKPDMLKGTLEATQFQGRYMMRWYDAEGNLMERDLRAEYDPMARVFTLHFPVQKAVLRFARR